MANQPAERRRPAELTAAIVLTYISAVVEIVVGVLVILARYLPGADLELRRFVTTVGAAVLLLGFLTVAVASGISRGDRHARLVLTALMSVSVVLSVAAVIFDDADLSVLLVNALISAGVIVVLWTGRAKKYFARETD